MKIAVGGFEPDTTEDEIRLALEKYGAVINSVTIQESDDESKYLAVIDVDTNEAGANVLVKNIDGHIWKDRKLSAMKFLF